MKNYTSTPEEIADRKAKRAELFGKVKNAIKENPAPATIATNQDQKPYSPFNQYMIAMQSGAPGTYAGFHSWRILGRKVSKGAHGVLIATPIMKKEEINGEEKTSAVNFSTAYIFHISQTEAI